MSNQTKENITVAQKIFFLSFTCNRKKNIVKCDLLFDTVQIKKALAVAQCYTPLYLSCQQNCCLALLIYTQSPTLINRERERESERGDFYIAQGINDKVYFAVTHIPQKYGPLCFITCFLFLFCTTALMNKVKTMLYILLAFNRVSGVDCSSENRSLYIFKCYIIAVKQMVGQHGFVNIGSSLSQLANSQGTFLFIKLM